MSDYIFKERNSSFELLRLVLMTLIVIHHSIIHGLGFSGMGLNESASVILDSHLIPAALVIDCLCICSVNCFILISGYFSINLRLKKFLLLSVTLFIYTLIFNTGFLISERKWLTALASMFVFSHCKYWFVRDYIYLMLFAPIINNLFTSLNKRLLHIFILTTIVISCYLGFVWNNDPNPTGYTLFQFIMIYCIGRYIKLYGVKLNRTKSFLLYILSAIATGLLMSIFWICDNQRLAMRTINYNNPLIILSAIGLFLFFRTFHFKSKFINKIAQSAFAIYLIQSSLWCWSFYYKDIWNSQSIFGGSVLLLIIPFSILVVIPCLLFDQLMRPIINYSVAFIARFIDKRFQI